MNTSSTKAKRFTYANVASTAAILALVAGTGGVAYAAGVAKNSVGSPQIINGSVKGVDISADTKKAFTAGPDAFYDELEFHNLESDDPDQTVFEFTVPRGNYLVSASGTIMNMGADVNDFTCSITQQIGEFTSTIATNEVRVVNGGGNVGTMAMDGVAVKAAGPLTLTMNCDAQVAPWVGQIQNPRIVAVELGSAIEK